MKTNLLLAMALFGLSAVTSSAQSALVFGSVNYSTTPAPACQAGACPAVGPAPAYYTRPVVYARPPVRYRSPDVIYVGAASGYPHPNYFSGCYYGPGYSTYCAPNVIYFGGGQAYVQGYAFRHCR